MLPEDILLRFLLFSCSVGSLESCVRGGVRGSMLLIRICLMVECTCYLGTSRWLMTVCIVICFPVARVLLIPGGSSLMIVGGGGGILLVSRLVVVFVMISGGAGLICAWGPMS